MDAFSIRVYNQYRLNAKWEIIEEAAECGLKDQFMTNVYQFIH